MVIAPGNATSATGDREWWNGTHSLAPTKGASVRYRNLVTSVSWTAVLPALVLVALAAAPVAAQEAEPSVSATAPNGQIAFVAEGPRTDPFGPPTQTDIWVMNGDGSGRRNLTDSPDVDDLSPAWSPDGTRIAYISDSFTNTLMVMNADGSGKVPVLDGAYSPSWGPQGDRIAVLRSDGTSSDLVIVDLVTGGTTVVGPDAGATMEPSWSPDGLAIAYVGVRPESYPDPITGEPVEGAQHEIVVIDVVTGGQVVVSAGPAGSDHASNLEEDRAPSWSPDSSKLVFMSQTQIGGCCGPWQLWAVNRDGTGLTNLTADDAVNDLYPSWSPDGSTIVFTRAADGRNDLFVMPAPAALPLEVPGPQGAARVVPTGATGEATPLTSDGNAQDPSWGRAQARPVRLTVTVQATSGAAGRIVSRPAGISCGTDCTHRYPVGTTVTLTATPASGSRFLRWSGACSGTARTCTVQMAAATRVVARFGPR